MKSPEVKDKAFS